MSNLSIRARNLAAGIVGSLMLIAGQPAMAWDGIASGAIYYFEVASGQNFAFRVHLKDVTNSCTGGPSWSYLNESDSNYKAFVAVLLAAKAQGASVQVFSTLENGYCHIGHIGSY